MATSLSPVCEQRASNWWKATGPTRRSSPPPTPAGARRLVVAVPNAFEAGQIILRARAANPGIAVIARAHSDAEADHLKGLGADTVIMGEREIARGMVESIVAAEAPPAHAADGTTPQAEGPAGEPDDRRS